MEKSQKDPKGSSNEGMYINIFMQIYLIGTWIARTLQGAFFISGTIILRKLAGSHKESPLVYRVFFCCQKRHGPKARPNKWEIFSGNGANWCFVKKSQKSESLKLPYKSGPRKNSPTFKAVKNL